jgi:hypothetical protein
MIAIQYNSSAFKTLFHVGYFLRATTEVIFFVISITVNRKPHSFRTDYLVQLFCSSESLNTDTVLMFDQWNILDFSIQKFKMIINSWLEPIFAVSMMTVEEQLHAIPNFQYDAVSLVLLKFALLAHLEKQPFLPQMPHEIYLRGCDLWAGNFLTHAIKLATEHMMSLAQYIGSKIEYTTINHSAATV